MTCIKEERVGIIGVFTLAFIIDSVTFNWASGKTEAVVEDSELLLLLATDEMSEQSLLSVLLFLMSKLLPLLKPGSPPLWTRLLVSLPLLCVKTDLMFILFIQSRRVRAGMLYLTEDLKAHWKNHLSEILSSRSCPKSLLLEWPKTKSSFTFDTSVSQTVFTLSKISENSFLKMQGKVQPTSIFREIIPLKDRRNVQTKSLTKTAQKFQVENSTTYGSAPLH